MRPLLAVSCLLLAHLVYEGAGHACGHTPPERVGYTSTTSSRTRRDATARQPIRIVPVYYEEDFDQLPSNQRTKYKSVAEKAINYLSSFLKVERLTQNLTLQRLCNITSSSAELASLNPIDHCTPDEPCQSTFCAFPEFPIPEDHLKACTTCETVGSPNCSTSGQDGTGVPDADFVVYVAARSFNCRGSTLAYAAHCFQDKTTDRPIAGVVNLCPNLENEQDIDNIVLTVAHELTHALVFSPLLMPFYHDENGNPRTPRNEVTGPPPLSIRNGSISRFQPSSNTIIQETVRREALNGVYDIDTVKVVTPAVLREARRHFGCSTLNGLELETLGGPGTQFAHWNKRLIENEGMTGAISTNGVFSRLTFALYEDSGYVLEWSNNHPRINNWYDVDYSVASPLRFGQCLGCDFAEKSCFSYGLSEEPFCDVQEFLPLIELGGRGGGANSSCTYDRLAIAACILADVTFFNLSIPIQYQYFSDPNLGGIAETLDFCPINFALSHCQRPRDLRENVFMETVGPTSKCVDFEIMTNWEYNSTSIPPIYGGACYEVSCASEGEVAITVGQTEILCQSAGQQVIVQAMGFDIVIICPGFEDICWENSTTCPAVTAPPAPPSGLSTGGAIAIGVTFGLLGVVVVAIIVVVVLVVICKRRGVGKGSSEGRGRSGITLEAYKPINADLAEDLIVEEA